MTEYKRAIPFYHASCSYSHNITLVMVSAEWSFCFIVTEWLFENYYLFSISLYLRRAQRFRLEYLELSFTLHEDDSKIQISFISWKFFHKVLSSKAHYVWIHCIIQRINSSPSLLQSSSFKIFNESSLNTKLLSLPAGELYMQSIKHT